MEARQNRVIGQFHSTALRSVAERVGQPRVLRLGLVSHFRTLPVFLIPALALLASTRPPAPLRLRRWF